MDLLAVFTRIAITYLYILFTLRLTGKRTIGSLTPMDFVVATMLGDMFDNIIWATSPVASSLVGITTLFIVHILVTYFSYKSPAFRRIVSSPVQSVIDQGKLVEEGMAKERTSEQEVLAAMRLKGEGKLDEVASGNWESNGSLSLIKKEFAKTAQKKDQSRLEELFE